MKIIYLRKTHILVYFFTIMIFIITLLFISTIKIMPVNANFEEKIEGSSDGDRKVAYLTFDDGPSIKETEKILDVLKEENIKATFFVIGENVKKYPEIVKREYEEGHYIANHSYYHNNGKLYSSKEAFLSEIKSTDLEIGKAIGKEDYCSRIFRFPNGYMSNIYKNQKREMLNVLEELDYYYIDWNCLNKDSEIKISNTELMENLKKSSKNKNPLIVLMHDTGDVNNTSEVLKASIKYLREEGYEFKNMYDFSDV